MGLSLNEPQLVDDPSNLPQEVRVVLYESHPDRYTESGTYIKPDVQSDKDQNAGGFNKEEIAEIEDTYYRHKDPSKVQASARKGIMEIAYPGTNNRMLRLCMCCEKLDKDPINILEARRVAIHAGITDIDDFMKLILEEQSHGVCKPCYREYYGDYGDDS